MRDLSPKKLNELADNVDVPHDVGFEHQPSAYRARREAAQALRTLASRLEGGDALRERLRPFMTADGSWMQGGVEAILSAISDLIAAEQAAAVERARAEAFEEAAKIADTHERDYEREWRAGHKADSHLQGMSDGAGDIASALRNHAGARAGDGGEGWHRIDRDGRTFLYTLRHDGFRRGKPVEVNDVTINIEPANGSTTDIAPVVEAIVRALPPAPKSEEGKR